MEKLRVEKLLYCHNLQFPGTEKHLALHHQPPEPSPGPREDAKRSPSPRGAPQRHRGPAELKTPPWAPGRRSAAEGVPSGRGLQELRGEHGFRVVLAHVLQLRSHGPQSLVYQLVGEAGRQTTQLQVGRPRRCHGSWDSPGRRPQAAHANPTGHGTSEEEKVRGPTFPDADRVAPGPHSQAGGGPGVHTLNRLCPHAAPPSGTSSETGTPKAAVDRTRAHVCPVSTQRPLWSRTQPRPAAARRLSSSPASLQASLSLSFQTLTFSERARTSFVECAPIWACLMFLCSHAGHAPVERRPQKGHCVSSVHRPSLLAVGCWGSQAAPPRE